jgi:hypothetical protein
MTRQLPKYAAVAPSIPRYPRSQAAEIGNVIDSATRGLCNPPLSASVLVFKTQVPVR